MWTHLWRFEWNAFHRLRYLTIWSSVGETVWERLRGGRCGLVEGDMLYVSRSGHWVFKRLVLLPVSLSLPVPLFIYSFLMLYNFILRPIKYSFEFMNKCWCTMCTSQRPSAEVRSQIIFFCQSVLHSQVFCTFLIYFLPNWTGSEVFSGLFHEPYQNSTVFLRFAKLWL